MKKRITGVALVLALALTSLGSAQVGPSVPGCAFERGVTTCAEYGPLYPGGLGVGDTGCFISGMEFRIVSGYADTDQSDFATTEYRGRSHVVKSQEIEVVVLSLFGAYSLEAIGTCLY